MKKLYTLLTELEKSIPHQALLNPQVSQVPVGWHIEHSLLVLNAIVSGLKKSRPAAYKPTFDWRRQVVLVLGVIPRGKIKAPAAVRPVETFNAASLQQHLYTTKANLESIGQLSPDHFFTHPFLGDFKLIPAVKFMQVHTRHHLKIIRDIRDKG